MDRNERQMANNLLNYLSSSFQLIGDLVRYDKKMMANISKRQKEIRRAGDNDKSNQVFYEKMRFNFYQQFKKQGLLGEEQQNKLDDNLKNESGNPKKEEEMSQKKYGDGTFTQRQRKRKDGSIYKFWQGRINVDGVQLPPVYAPTLAECKEKTKKLKEDTISESQITAFRSIEKCDTLNKWAEKWYDIYKKNKYRPNSAHLFERQYQNYIKNGLGKLKLKEITSTKIQLFLNSIELGNTKEKLYIYLNDILNAATNEGLISKNPCVCLEKPKHKKIHYRAFELFEQNLIVEEKSRCHEYEIYKNQQAFIFLCCTGLRIGEFLALTKTDIDFEKRTIKVNKQVDRNGKIVNYLKTDTSERVVCFDKSLILIFNFDLLGTYKYSALHSFIDRRKIKYKLKKGLCIHSTRHTYCSILINLKVSPVLVQNQLGHSSVETTLNNYTHILLNGDSIILQYLKNLKSTLESTHLSDGDFFKDYKK